MSVQPLLKGKKRQPPKARDEESFLAQKAWHLFDVFGVELEYMIVDRKTLAVRPDADKILGYAGGAGASEVEFAETAWSNELVLHVLEMKTVQPRGSLIALDGCFQTDVRRANEILATWDAMLMPTSMHPWMDPATETRLWPHAQNEIYEAYDRIFGVKGHGWANVQSTHINLPFADEDEFVRLHAAIRVVLPLLPALAASSPLQDGRLTGLMDNRLMAYSMMQQRVPSVTGRVIPEAVRSLDAYQDKILRKMYRDIAPLDPDGVLQHEWLNSRGAIARFDRNAIEIRLLDIQEHPGADVAIAALITCLLQKLTAEKWTSVAKLHKVPGELLERLFFGAIRDAEQTRIWNREYLKLFGVSGKDSMTMNELWHHILTQCMQPEDLARTGWGASLKTIIEHGTLARRISNSLGANPGRERINEVYGKLANCLENGVSFQ